MKIYFTFILKTREAYWQNKTKQSRTKNKLWNNLAFFACIKRTVDLEFSKE